MAVNAGARLWSSFKELNHVVETAIHRRQYEAIQDLEVILRKHKPDFISLLQNPAKIAVHREGVKKAATEGINIQGQQGTQILSQDFIDEALIISDLFDLNEYAAVELLMAGENQQPSYPGLARGLVAVLLYYDGRMSMVNALKSLIQAREGHTFTLGLNEELVALVTRFTKQLIAEGMADKILGLIKHMNCTEELEKLHKQKALGPPKHRKLVAEFLKNIKLGLAECLFCWSCQTPLSREDTLHLIQHLQTNVETTPDGKLDPVTVTLLMALLYSLDIHILDQEDAEDVIQELPIRADTNFVPDIHREIVTSHKWSSAETRAIVQFAWSVTLRGLSQCSSVQGTAEYSEQDENIFENAVKENVFFVLKNFVLESENFFKEQFFVRKMHNLVADFIVQMPLKVKELRNRGDETARIITAHLQEGVQPPANLPRDFEHLMYLISGLYGEDPLGLQLGLEFWCPPDPMPTQAGGGMTVSYHYRPPQRQISLFKFVRQAGDLLPPSLYIPYVEMLAGLANGPQCAHHCFNLLKSNSHMPGGQASTVSWDHFFISINQYYSSLRQEAPMTSDLPHIYRHHHRGITPQEVEGLMAVLKLIKTVAEYDESARVALAENQQWVPVVGLLGLISCSVPLTLKAELLLTLAAFAKSSEIASSLWQSLEVSQILPTVSSTHVQQQGGIQVELDEVEARMEEFPMTRAFLQLLNNLTDYTIPTGLGSGYRAPGFDPYLNFLRDSVLLKFNTRAYKVPQERWQVGSAVLEIMLKLLSSHQIAPEDFTDHHVELQGGGSVVANKRPGHTILIHLLNDTPMLRMILYIIDEATKLLEKYTTFPGKSELEQAVLSCMKMLELTFEKQGELMMLLRESGASVMVCPIDRLLLSINPRSGRPDHVVNIAKYVTYGSELGEHALYAVKILCWVSQSPLAQPELVGLFTTDHTISQALLQGFVDCLETEEPEDLDPSEQEEEMSCAQICNATRQSIMRLLLSAIDQPAPNLAHFLLGFEIRKPVSKTNLQDPGVLGSPRTCLHSVLTLLERDMGTGGAPACLTDMPQLAELAYHLIYVLCANKDTSSPVMRYLRTAHDFLYRHLNHLPFATTFANEEGKTSTASENLLLRQQSWLLKAVAIELRLTAANRQRSHTQRLISLLLEDNPSIQQKLLRTDGTYEPDYMLYDMESLSFNLTNSQIPQYNLGGQSRRKLLSVLDSIDFKQESSDGLLQLEYFEPMIIEQAIHMCEHRTEHGYILCDVKRLHNLLMSELSKLHGSSAVNQRAPIIQEIQRVCANVVKRNTGRESMWAKRQAFDSWRQVVEVILTACPEDLLAGESRHNVLLELLQDLLRKVADEEAVGELTAPVAGVFLTLMSNLRLCFLSEQSELTHLQNLSHYMTLLDGRLPDMTSVKHSSLDDVNGLRSVFSSLQVVLKGLLEHILRSSSSQQRVRANLYGALLYFLQIAQKPKTMAILDSVAVREKSVGASLTAADTDYERLTQDNLATISSYGDNLMEVICRDACDGHDVGRMLALATLDSILTFDIPQQWLSYMTSKGYIDHIVKSLLQDDDKLQDTLTPHPESLKALYIYESKMGLLTKVAQTATGAHNLLHVGVMARLAECAVYSMRPDLDRPENAGLMPTLMQRYRQVLTPTIKLSLAILTSLGIENRAASGKVLQFIVAHMDVFLTILRDRQTLSHLAVLEEMALTTALISRAALDEGEDTLVLGDSANHEFRSNIARLQRQMFALLPKYCLSDSLFKQIRTLTTESGSQDQDTQLKMQLTIEDIAANVISFARNLVSQSGTSSKLSRLLFGPSMVEATSRDLHRNDEFSSNLGSLTRPPNIGIIVFMLHQATTRFMNVFDLHKQTQRKLESVTTLSNEELKELCGSSTSEKMSSQQKHQVARRRLVYLITCYAQQLRNLSYMVENCLFILWRHLEFYLVHCVPADHGTSLFHLNAKKQRMRRLQEYPGRGSPAPDFDMRIEPEDLGSGVTKEDLEQLKLDAVACVNETLFKKLLDIEQSYAKNRTRYGFMEALVRRLKRLLKLHTSPSV